MTKHDTWVKLIPGNPLEGYIYLFPDGIPMRDPFAMEYAKGSDGEPIAIWVVDLERLNGEQFTAIAKVIAVNFNADPEDIKADAFINQGFAFNGAWIASMECGAEGLQRTKELVDFLESAPQPPSAEAFEYFLNDQVRRWIDGDEVPPPLPTSIDEVDPKLRTPEMEAALLMQQANKMLSNYSVLDVLTGRATADILNQLDPEGKYLIAGWDDGKEEL